MSASNTPPKPGSPTGPKPAGEPRPVPTRPPEPARPTPTTQPTRGTALMLCLLAAAALLSLACTGADVPPPTKGDKRQAQAAPMHIRMWAAWKKHPNGGTVFLSGDSPEGSAGPTHGDTSKPGKWFFDADLPPHESAALFAEQSTPGEVSCWIEEISPTGVKVSQIGPTKYIHDANVQLECFYVRGAVD